MLNIAGLVLNLIGVLMLFFWGMPFRTRTGGARYRIIQQTSEEAIALERRNEILGYVGLTALILGTLCQIIATLLS
jgi:hypothetical protein